MRIEILSDEVVYDGVFIQTIRRSYRGSDGKKGIWEVVRRKTRGRVVGIAAITPEKEIILEKSFRVPIENHVIELPAGLMDKEGESEEETARRELLEETGYTVEKMVPLVSGTISAGIITDEIAIYAGIGARKISEQQLEGSEDIEVVKVPLSGLVDYLLKQIGGGATKVDVKIGAVLPFFEKLELL